LIILSHIEKISFFQFFITTLSQSSSEINLVATELRAFISLEIYIQSSHSQTIIGLHSFAQIKVSGFSLSIITIAYAPTIFLHTFSTVDSKSQVKYSSISFAITSLSVSL